MTNYDILRKIESVYPHNHFIDYIINRIQDDNYRGIQCSQHNRLTYDYFRALIEIIYKSVGDKMFCIHVGDDKGVRQPQAAGYYTIVNNIKNVVGKGTINSVKKNTFPDLARAGFLERFDKNEMRITETFTIGEEKIARTRSNIYKVRLSNLGIRFAQASSEFERRKYYTDAVDTLTKNAATDLVELLSTDERVESVSIEEFMYIFSDDRENVRYNDKLMYLSDYRKLSEEQKNQVDLLLKEYCNPERNTGDKTNSRDYHNWKNESQQIFNLLSNSTYFKVINGNLLLNNGEYGLFLQPAQRGQRPRDRYFKYHNVSKKTDYELHHIIPFKKANTQRDARYIDDERNLIYLSSSKHAEFTSTHNINIRASFKEPVISFLRLNDIDGIINVDLSKKDALVSNAKIAEMVEYNKKLLNVFYSA